MTHRRRSTLTSPFAVAITAFAAVAALTACGTPAKRPAKPAPTAKATPSPSPSATPEPSSPPADPTPAAPVVDADIAALGDKIANLPARAAFTSALMKRRSDGPGKRSYSIGDNDLFEMDNAYSVTLEERSEAADGASCQVGPIVVELAKGDPKLPPVEIRTIGTDCCPGTACPAPTAIGAMLRFTNALSTQDVEAFRKLIHPKKGLAIEMTDGGGTEKQKVKASKLDMKKLHLSAFIWSNYDLSCTEFDAKNEATCSASAGGFQGQYGLVREGANVYLLTVEDSSE